MMGPKPLLAVGTVVIVLGSAVADGASGSSLKVVLPAHARAQHNFNYTIKGTFPTMPGGAWVIGLSQPKTAPCRSTEPKDWKGPSSYQLDWTHEASSPFTLAAKWRGVRQSRRLCVYLYSQMFFPLGNSLGSKLLATAQTVIPK